MVISLIKSAMSGPKPVYGKKWRDRRNKRQCEYNRNFLRFSPLFIVATALPCLALAKIC